MYDSTEDLHAYFFLLRLCLSSKHRIVAEALDTVLHSIRWYSSSRLNKYVVFELQQLNLDFFNFCPRAGEVFFWLHSL